MAPTPGSRFRPSRRGIGELLRSPGMQMALMRVAVAIEAEAIATAPVGTPPDDPHPGLYKRSFSITSRVASDRGGRRVVVYVRNLAPHAARVEYGAEGGRGGAHHTLLRAALTGGRSVLR